ncbi:MAG TPA: hypothetical protein VN030_13260 [Cellvibrio sp.]|nr:hypothetical protein [Cellvibrio sp.]
MDINQVPQEGNATLAGVRKAVYARAADGQIVTIASQGWEVEEIVTQQAVDALKEQAQAALARAKAGQSSALEYWMYEKRMDPVVLAQSTGLWQWRVRRHLQAARFAKLSPKVMGIYADALGLAVEQLKTLP